MLYDAIFNQVDEVMHNHNTVCSVLQVWVHKQTNLVGQCQLLWYRIKADLLLKKLIWS